MAALFKARKTAHLFSYFSLKFNHLLNLKWGFWGENGGEDGEELPPDGAQTGEFADWFSWDGHDSLFSLDDSWLVQAVRWLWFQSSMVRLFIALYRWFFFFVFWYFWIYLGPNWVLKPVISLLIHKFTNKRSTSLISVINLLCSPSRYSNKLGRHLG